MILPEDNLIYILSIFKNVKKHYAFDIYKPSSVYFVHINISQKHIELVRYAWSMYRIN